MQKEGESSTVSKSTSKGTKTLLVIECSGNLNWYQVFRGAIVSGYDILIEQAEWDDISIISYDSGQVMCTLRRAAKPLEGSTQNKDRTIVLDFVLLRSVTRGISNQDSRNKLFALMHGSIPSVNSLIECLCLSWTLFDVCWITKNAKEIW